MAETRGARLYRWESMPKEKVTDTISRRIITGEGVMLAHIYLEKGAIVPTHSHHNEQITYLLEGVLRLWVGEEREEFTLHPGEVLHIPPNVPHSAEALEDCLDVDVFAPPREDWLNGTDDYFHRK